MRILVCSNGYPPDVVGGAELVAHDQASALALAGHEVRAFAGDLRSPRSRHERFDDAHEGIPVHRIALAAEDYSPEFLNFLHPRVEAHFRDVMRSFRPDVVHCHNLVGLSVRLPAIARAQGARIVCTLHDFWGFCPRNTALRPDGAPCTGPGCCLPRLHDGRGLDLLPRLRRDFLTLALDGVDRFVTPSRFVADRYVWAGFPSERIVVIPNGVDADRFRPALRDARPDKPVRLAYAGYLGAHKGITTLIAAMAALPSGSAELSLAGEGPEEASCRALAQELGIAGQVRFLGKVPPTGMPAVYEQSDLVVLASLWDENQPVCLMEAMASGLPVVAPRRGGIPEIVAHGETGLLFAPGDVDDLAAKLATLVADPVGRAAMGREGRRRVEGLSHASQAGRLLALYDGMRRRPHAREVGHRVFAVMGDRWEQDLAGGPTTHGLDPDPAYAGARQRLFVPLEWMADMHAPAGVLFVGHLRPATRVRYFRCAIPFPRYVAWVVIALLGRLAGPAKESRRSPRA